MRGLRPCGYGWWSEKVHAAGAGRMCGCAPGLGALPIELPPGSPQADRTRTCNIPISSGNRRGFDSPGTQQHDEPTAEHHYETAGGIEPPCAVLQTATSATRSCGHARAQDDSNVRLLLRRKPCCPLHYEPRALPAGLEPALPPSEGGVLSTGPWKHRARGRNRTFNAEATGLRPAEHTACSTRAWGE
ncbi:MAG: hypothetical protein QOJ73_6806 [Streptosporangiaceae bacterium]|jgi:hypothetical protein|nr:hypothetical protein [Streptosporangiaceae bacterium]